MAELEYHHGPMGSGKSIDVLKRAYTYERVGMAVLVIKPRADTKKPSSVVSRTGMERQADIISGPYTDLEKIVLKHHEIIKAINAVITDESQFFKPKQVDQLFRLAVFHSINVFAYGLRSDFQRKSFSGSRRLLEISHKIVEQSMVCNCGEQALFNARKINGDYVFNGKQVAIDGQDNTDYEALCGKCYLDEQAKTQKS